MGHMSELIKHVVLSEMANKFYRLQKCYYTFVTVPGGLLGEFTQLQF